jgi:hypothetical protein
MGYTAHLQVHHVECAPQLPQDEHLPLNVLQVLLLLDGRQVGHIQTLADALAGKLSARGLAANDAHAAKASLAQLPARLNIKITAKVTRSAISCHCSNLLAFPIAELGVCVGRERRQRK